MGGWKQKSGWIQILPDSCVPFTFFLFYLNYLSVSLSRVCAPTLPLTNTLKHKVKLTSTRYWSFNMYHVLNTTDHGKVSLSLPVPILTNYQGSINLKLCMHSTVPVSRLTAHLKTISIVRHVLLNLLRKLPTCYMQQKVILTEERTFYCKNASI